MYSKELWLLLASEQNVFDKLKPNQDVVTKSEFEPVYIYIQANELHPCKQYIKFFKYAHKYNIWTMPHFM